MKVTLLSIDDTPDMHTLLAGMLRRRLPDLNLVHALDGREGLRLARDLKPDVIVVDVCMPEMDGYEVCQRLKQDPATSFIPLLMVSGTMTSSKARAVGLDVGAEGFLCKPYDTSELVAQVQALLRMRRNEDLLRRDLAEKELRFQTLFEHSPDAIFVEDLQGTILDVNQAACKLHGMERRELVGMSALDLVPHHAVEDVRKALSRMAEGKLSYAQGQSVNKEGRSIPVELRVTRLDYEGQPALLLHVRDVTERHEAEQREKVLQDRLARSERMESLGILAGGVAHDLNNILGPLVAYPELIREEIPDLPRVHEDLAQMADSAHRAAAVIQDLLSLARRGNYKRQPVDLGEVVSSYAQSSSQRQLSSEYPGLQLRVDMAEDRLPLLGSSSHLVQLVMNLVRNAYEAMAGAGSVSVSVRTITVAEHTGNYDTIPEGLYTILSVRDSGSGISATDLDHIFEPFYTRKKMGRSGSGLGLAQVYGVVKDHQGYIDVASKEGEGTEFLLYFPATQTTPEQESRSLLTLSGQERILVVDDVEGQRELACRLLARLGYEVAAVEDCRGALQYLSAHKADLVILDMVMENGPDGLDTFRRIRDIVPGQRCLIASGYAETKRVLEAQRLGAGAYLRKPYTLENLGAAVRKELDQVDAACQG